MPLTVNDTAVGAESIGDGTGGGEGVKFITVLACAIILTACTNQDDAMRALKAEGFTDIEFTGYDWFACSEDDFYHTGFVATKNGNRADGTVCSGLLFKGSTIRWK